MQNEAWLDEENRIVSFHEIPNSRYYSAEEHDFWQVIVSLILDTVRLILTAQVAPLPVRTIFSCYGSMLVTLVMSLGAVICLAVLGHRIRRGVCCKNLFTRCLMPSFLFIPVSDAFMLLSALAHANLPHTLFRRHKRPAWEKGTHL